MKKALLFGLGLAFSLFSLQSFAQAGKSPSPLPPIKELPEKGEVKVFFDLEGVYDYEVFEVTGKKITSGNAQHVDVTKFKKGTYFFSFDGRKVQYKKD